LDIITDLHQDVLYEHQFQNGKIISSPKFRIVDPTTTTEESTTIQTTPTTMTEQATTTSLSETTESATFMIPTTVQPEIDWEHMNELDEQETRDNTELVTPVLARIIGALITVGSTIVYSIYQLCTLSDTMVYNNVTSVVS